MRSLSIKRKFNGEVFTLRDTNNGGYFLRKKDAQEAADFIRSKGKKVRVVPTGPHGYLLYERGK